MFLTFLDNFGKQVGKKMRRQRTSACTVLSTGVWCRS